MHECTVYAAGENDTGSILEIDRLTRRPWKNEYVDMFISGANHRTYVMKNDFNNKVVAYICLRRLSLDLRIDKLVVKEGLRNIGLGTYLLASALSRLSYSEVKSVFTWTDERDLHEAKFYSHRGFRACLLQGKFEGCHDAYEFRRNIPQTQNLSKMLTELRLGRSMESDLSGVCGGK